MKPYRPLFEALKLIGYHGTPFDFDSFDEAKIGTRNDPGDYGSGVYFDTDKRQAVAYAAMGPEGFILTCEIYLRRHVYIDFKAYSEFDTRLMKGETAPGEINEELNKFIETLKKGGINIVETVGKYDKWGETFHTFLSISRKYGSDKITQALKKQGYDGVVVDYGHSKEIVVFNPEIITIIKKEAR